MAYKYSIGSQVIGDLKASSDAQGDTQIDFGEDVIDLQTSGSSVLKISGSHVYLANGSDLHLGGNSRIYFDSDDINTDVSVFERAGGDGLIIDGNDRVRFRADNYVIFQAPNGSPVSEPVLIDYNNDKLHLHMLLSSSQDISASALHTQEGITLGGQNVLDNQGNLSVSTVDAGTISGSDIIVTDENGPVYQLPITDGTSGQVIMTDGAGNLTFSSVSGGGGGGGGSASPAGSDTEIQINNNGALGASSNLTFDGSTLGINGTIEHDNYSKTLYPSNQTNTGSYAKQKSFVKELFYSKYDWSGTSYTDLFTIEPYDERTGLPYTGSSVWAVVGIECTLTGHRRFYGNTFTKNYMVLDWAAGTSRSYGEYTGVRIGADPSVWFDADTSVSTNGIKLRFIYNNGSVGNANLHFVINAGYPIDDLSAGSDGKYIYWVLTEHFNEPSE